MRINFDGKPVTAKCADCGEQVTKVWLISNFAGGARNAAELLACRDHWRGYVTRGAAALGVEATFDGPFGDAVLSDERFVKAMPIDILTAQVAALSA